MKHAIVSGHAGSRKSGYGHDGFCWAVSHALSAVPLWNLACYGQPSTSGGECASSPVACKMDGAVGSG